MQAVRQFAKVVDHKVTVDLPVHFEARQVEIIVLPAEEAETLQDEPLDPVIKEFLELDTSDFTPEQKEAYDRVVAYIGQGRKEGDPYPLGLFAGFGHVSEDFDAPLPDEDLWYGSETDEYGISLSNESAP